MNINVRYPSITEGAPEQQLKEIKSYLYQLTDTLNACDNSAAAVLSEIDMAISAGEVTDKSKAAETELKLQEYSSLRSLIIKTADYALGKSDTLRLSLSGNYVTVSDFGKYFENATVDINGTPYGITQLYDYSAGIDAEGTDYRVNQESYIKTGLLYYDANSLPVYGVGVGTIYGDFSVYGPTTDTVLNSAKTYYTKNGDTYTAVEEPKQEDLGEYYERVLSRQANQMYSTFTSDEMAFWSGSTKLAYMNTSSINFPNANITGGSIVIGGTEDNPAFSVNPSGYMQSRSGKIANWNIGVDNLYTDGATFDNTAGMYFGESGLRIGKNFKVDSDGVLNASSGTFGGSLNAATGTFSGTLQAADGTFAGSLSAATGTFAGSLSAATGTFAGKLSAATGTFAGSLSAGVSISSPVITGGTITSTSIYAATIYASSSSTGNYSKMTASGLEVYVAQGDTQRKVLLGQNPSFTTSRPSLILGSDTPAYVSKYAAVGNDGGTNHYMWIGNGAMTCGIMFNFTDKTYKFYGTQA